MPTPAGRPTSHPHLSAPRGPAAGGVLGSGLPSTSSSPGSARGPAPDPAAPDGQAPAEPVPAEPTSAEPAPSGQAAAEQAAAEQAPAEPVPSEPVLEERLLADPISHGEVAGEPEPRRILHLDVDAFLASVEQALHPELAGRPVVVGGAPDSRNLVMSCSYEARAFGVRPGMPSREAARRCPQAVFREGDSQAANRLREGVARILHRVSPRVEIASIDDFFVDLAGTRRLHGSAFAVAERIRETVCAELRLPLTIGIGANRTVARLAGKLAKPGGIAEIRPGYEESFLRGLPVRHLPGVGHAIGRLLERFSIRTVGELALVSREVLFASFGSAGLVLYERARGIDATPVDATFRVEEDGSLRLAAPRSIQRVSTFEPEEGRRELVEAMLAYLVERAAHRLRAHRLVARSVEVRAQYVDTRPPAAQRRSGGEGSAFGRRRRLERATDSTDELIRHARRLLRELPRRRALVKRVGVTLVDLAHDVCWQGSLFDTSLPEPDEAAERAPALAPRASAAPPADSSPPAGAATRGGRAPEHSREPLPRRHDIATTAGDGGAGRLDACRVDRQRRLDRVLDELRGRHGFGRVLRGASLPLVERTPLGPDGFRLRTPSLNQ